MTLTEVVVSSVILGISSQVSLQGWSRTSQAAATSARTDQHVAVAGAKAPDQSTSLGQCSRRRCRLPLGCLMALVGVLEGLPEERRARNVMAI